MALTEVLDPDLFAFRSVLFRQQTSLQQTLTKWTAITTTF